MKQSPSIVTTGFHQAAAPGTSTDVPGLCGAAFCLVLPLLGWFYLQALPGFRLTDTAWVDGAWHTLWTGHLLHYGLEHFAWDAIMFSSFALLLWKDEGWRLWCWMALAAPIISLAVFAWHLELGEYRGLSALDTMLFVRYCLGSIRRLAGWQLWCGALLPLLALTVKISYEFYFGRCWFVSDMGPGVVPLPSAHLVGALIGILWFGWSFTYPETGCVEGRGQTRPGSRADVSRVESR